MFFITSISQRRLTLPVVRVPSHTSAIIVCREVKTNPKMLRTESKAAPESVTCFPHYDYGSSEHTMEKKSRIPAEEPGKRFDSWTSHLNQRFGDIETENRTNQRAVVPNLFLLPKNASGMLV